MSVLGGQNHTFCGVHECPLVLNYTKKDRMHIQGCAVVPDSDGSDMALSECCGDRATHLCPWYKDCKIGICARHLLKAKAVCAEKTPETVLSLSLSGSLYVDHQARDDGAVREPSTVARGFKAETLGPVSAHEIPHDFFDYLSSDDEESDVAEHFEDVDLANTEIIHGDN